MGAPRKYARVDGDPRRIAVVKLDGKQQTSIPMEAKRTLDLIVGHYRETSGFRVSTSEVLRRIIHERAIWLGVVAEE